MNWINNYLESIRHYPFPGTRALRQELDAVNASHATVSAELATVQEDLQHTREDDAQLIAGLRQQVSQSESERGNARYQTELLQQSLADAEQRQQSTAAHVNSLETRLEEERNRHEASRHATEASQARMQNDQQSLLALQSGLSNTFQQVAARMLENKPPRHSPLQLMLIAGSMFVTGTLAGVLAMQNVQDSGQELAVVQQDMRDLRVFMKRHIENQDALLKELTLALNRQTFSTQTQDGEQPLGQAAPQEADTPPPETVSFTPDIRELQTSLIALGFDLGISKPDGELDTGTRQALQEFRQFYLPLDDGQDGVISEPLAELLLQSAKLARADAERFFRIDSDVLAAIRLGSIRTGVEFTFLMELARVESNFNPVARAQKSSATGLFQFTNKTWLQTVRAYGADYGLKDHATRVGKNANGKHGRHQDVLALRLNPRLSALLAAENTKRSLQNLSYQTRREPGRTDLYLSHFFGPSGAVMFLKSLDEEPATIAGKLFPEAAASNRRVFHNGENRPRTVAEVYRWLDSKFNTARYDEHNPG